MKLRSILPSDIEDEAVDEDFVPEVPEVLSALPSTAALLEYR